MDDQGSGVHASADLSPMANTGGQVDPGIPVLGRWAVGACEAFVIQLYQVLRMALAIFHSVFNAPKICPGTVTESVTTVNATDELPCSPLHGSQSSTISAGPKKKSLRCFATKTSLYCACLVYLFIFVLMFAGNANILIAYNILLYFVTFG